MACIFAVAARLSKSFHTPGGNLISFWEHAFQADWELFSWVAAVYVQTCHSDNVCLPDAHRALSLAPCLFGWFPLGSYAVCWARGKVSSTKRKEKCEEPNRGRARIRVYILLQVEIGQEGLRGWSSSARERQGPLSSTDSAASHHH